MEHEEAMVRAFIKPNRRARYLKKLGSPSARGGFLMRHFYHMVDLDERYAWKIDPRTRDDKVNAKPKAQHERIYEMLTSRGAPLHCYVVSTDLRIDGRQMKLSEALERVVGSRDGTFISCLPGGLAYFEGEDDNERFILERPVVPSSA